MKEDLLVEIHEMCKKILSIIDESENEEAVFVDKAGNVICKETDLPDSVINTEKYHNILNSKDHEQIRGLLDGR